MEVSPEIYAWLSSLNIIEPFNETNKNGMYNYFIPQNVLNSLFNGEYMSLLIYDLQEAYNKYFDKRKDCTPKLSELILKEKFYNKLSEKTKLHNWTVINDALKLFDIKYSKNELNKVVNGNTIMLLKIITNIFYTITLLLKYTKKDTNKDNNELKNKNKTTRENFNMNYLDVNQKSNFLYHDRNNKLFNIENNSTPNTNRNSDILKKMIRNDSSSSVMNTINNDYFNNITTNNTEGNKIINQNNQENKSIENNNNISFNNNNNNNIDILNSERPLIEYVDVNKLSADTLYNNCTSTLEFFIISLCKNFKIKPVQAIGLLSNNRKYLSIMCLSGINGNYMAIKRWLEDLQINYDILLKLIFKYVDGIYMTYCIIGTALCSKNEDISIYAVDLLSQLFRNVGMNIDWFKKTGLNSFIFTFIKHSDKILYFLNTMCELIKNDVSIFFDEIRTRINNDDEYKTLIYDIIPNIIEISKNIENNNFFNNFKSFLFEICLHEEIRLSYSCSILCQSFLYYYQIIDNILANKINLYFKKCLRSANSNLYGSTISKIMVLIDKLSRVYNQYAPSLYKTMISLFIDMYDDLPRREIFLLNFENFALEHKEMPIDIFLEPYLNKLKNTKNYNLCDFTFLAKILRHPRIEYNDIFTIITFLLNITFNNIVFNRCAIFIMETILYSYIPYVYLDETQMKDLHNLFFEYICKAFELYIMNENNNYNGILYDKRLIEEDKFESLLEMPYFIIENNVTNINDCIKIKIIEVAKIYYDIHKKHSGILLGMLKIYDDFGGILYEIEKEANN